MMRQFLMMAGTLILVMISLTGCQPKVEKKPPVDSTFYERLADQQMREEQYEQALTNWNKAIELNNYKWQLYYLRALAKRNLSRFTEAVADFDQSLALSPGNALILADRGSTKAELNDLNGAMMDLNYAVQRAPQSFITHNSRGFLKLTLKDFSGADYDFSTAIILQPRDEFAGLDAGYLNRGILRSIKGQREEALSDYKKAIMAPEPNENTNYAYLMIWLERAAKGETDAASVALTHQVVENWTKDQWSQDVAAFLTDQINENEVLQRSQQGRSFRRNGQQCEVWYYVGKKRLLAGNIAGASEAFHKSVGTARTDYTEYHLASAELDRMKNGTGLPIPTQPAPGKLLPTKPIKTIP